MNAGIFPEDSAARKEYPVFSGLLQYFPSALAAIANHSFKGNEKHNPGLPLHHDRAKSSDEPDALVRHLMEGDYVGMAWRALSLLQKHCESQGAPVAPSARNVARQLYDETSALAAAQDAKLDKACPTLPARHQFDAGSAVLWMNDIGIPAESAYLASFDPNAMQVEALREIHIGDVEPRHVAETATTVATSQHPMAAEALRDEYEKTDKETGV